MFCFQTDENFFLCFSRVKKTTLNGSSCCCPSECLFFYQVWEENKNAPKLCHIKKKILIFYHPLWIFRSTCPPTTHPTLSHPLPAYCTVLYLRTVEERAVKLDLENMNLLLRNMPPKVDTEEVRYVLRKE